MTGNIDNQHPIRRWFAGLVESSFQTRLGVCDPSLLDYLASLLTDFLHVENIHTLGDGSGRKIEDLSGMLHEIEVDRSPAQEARLREIHRHIGDYTLFWTGVYPENLKRLHRKHDRDELLPFFETGKRSYSIASHLSDDGSRPPRRILEILSTEFESCVYGLGLVRAEWEHSKNGDGLTLL
ncbi:MAG TPA: hypothetical protein VMV81_11050 [Phycisphaerae bacterium]|nr:hypothetical protein [Phycisphaerae bacterium]